MSASRVPWKLGSPRGEYGEAFVYFAVLDEYPVVKVGVSTDPRKRARRLGVRLVLVEPGGRARERELHAEFSEWRCEPHDGLPAEGRTEWFWRANEVDEYLQSWSPDPPEGFSVGS